jgi:hypothetical protein
MTSDDFLAMAAMCEAEKSTHKTGGYLLPLKNGRNAHRGATDKALCNAVRICTRSPRPTFHHRSKRRLTNDEPGQPVPTQFDVRIWYCQKQQAVDLAELSVQITWGQCQGSNGLYMPGEYVNLSIGRYPVPPAGAWAYLTIGPHNNGGEVLVAQKRVNSIRCDVVPH